MTLFRQALANFQLLPLTITLQLQSDGELPPFKGSMWHGWLGHALKQVSEPAFTALYQQHDHEQPKPYAIQPGYDQKTQWRRGECIDFGLTLFGQATELWPVLLNALHAGQILGIGPARIKLRLVTVAVRTPTGNSLDIQPHSLGAFLQPWEEGSEPSLCQVHLQLRTPLRLKHKGQLVQHPDGLTPQLLAKQARRRLMQLTRYWVADDPALLQAIDQQPLGCQDVQLLPSLYYEDWQRFSLRQQEFLSFGGLKGGLACQGMVQPFYRWLQLAALLQLGGKTTFGLGCIELAPGSSSAGFQGIE